MKNTLIYLGLNLSLFGLVHLIHFLVFPPKIILYAGIADALVAQVLFFLIVKKKGSLSLDKSVLIAYAGVVTAVAYSVLIPTAIDRSLSLYMLRDLDARGGSISIETFKSETLQNYYGEMKVLEQRLEEQLATGSIEKRGDEVVLTEKGQLILGITNTYRSLLLPPSDRY